MAGSITVVTKFNNLGKLATSLSSNCADVSEETADDIVEDAQRRVPVDTGALQESIHKEPGGIGWLVVATEPYAARIEFGFNGTDSLGRLYHQAARPYLTPAAESKRSPFLSALKAALNRA
jgi:Bacteriophage HK97-gp10, putative tail-component